MPSKIGNCFERAEGVLGIFQRFSDFQSAKIPLKQDKRAIKKTERTVKGGVKLASALGFFESLALALKRFLVIFLDSVPVNNVPDSFEVIGATVLVEEVIGVLPDVHTEDGGAGAFCDAFHERVILVGSGADAQGFVVVDAEPNPAAAEACDACGFEFGLEVGEGAEGFLDCFGELAYGLTAFAWAEDFPKEGVVPVSSAVIADGIADGIGE